MCLFPDPNGRQDRDFAMTSRLRGADSKQEVKALMNSLIQHISTALPPCMRSQLSRDEELEGNGPVEPAASRAIEDMWCIVGILLLWYLLLFAKNSYSGRGHDGLQTSSVAFEVKFDIIFDTSNLNYPGIYVHIACNSQFGGL